MLSALGPAPLQGRKSLVDVIDGECLGIEIAANPFQHFLMLVVGWITDSFQEDVETRNTPAVFGRTLEFAAHPNWISKLRFGW